MRIEIDITKSVYENAAYYYDMAKKFRKKAEGAERAIRETEEELQKEEAQFEKRKAGKPQEKSWYEKFRFCFTHSGKLVIGGRDASQNEEVVARYFEREDLFFHADVQGGSVVVLKNGREADESEKEQAARFAAVYSKAWSAGYGSVDVYCAEYGSVSKHAHGMSVGKGGFVVKGRREWFKNVELWVLIGRRKETGRVECGFSDELFERFYRIVPGNTKKEKMAKELAERLGCSLDELLSTLPAGDCAVIGD
ncbi:MAG: NFACT RNA binding domain-containing protein [Candidatus Micrarchaeia archaeon]